MRSNTINSNKAACYLRLSREDGDKAESDSISNQRNLINDYVNQRNGIKLIKEYVDMYNQRLIQCPAHESVEKWLK